MQLDNNKSTVRTLMEAMRARKIETCRHLVADDLIARIPASSHILGNAVVVYGADEVLRVKAAIRGDSFAESMDLKINALLGDGDFVAAFCEIKGMSSDVKSYSNQYVFLFRFRGDKISEWDAFMDTAYVYQQLGFKIVRQ